MKRQQHWAEQHLPRCCCCSTKGGAGAKKESVSFVQVSSTRQSAEGADVDLDPAAAAAAAAGTYALLRRSDS